MLHEGGAWLDHYLDDDAALQATAADSPSPDLVQAAVVGAPAQVGQWGDLQNWPNEWINALMLPTGKVLGYDRTLNLRLWDPVTNTFTSPSSPGFNFFCTGTSLLADGTVLMTGGAVVDTVGLPFAAIYNPFNDTWTQAANMNAGRWYPSTTTLANGDALVLSGDTNGNVTDPLPQVYDYDTGEWRDLTTAIQTLSFYPRTFSAPNGDAFVAGPDPLSQYLDTSGTGQWIPVAYRVEPYRSFGSAVMYEPGKVLYVGGGSPASKTAEVIDLNDPNPQWRLVGSMEFARRNCNATLLPDGEVLITGGNTGSVNYDGDAVLAAEIWDPKTETFRTVADESDIRWYHSTALLLPDGRVLSTSGDLHLTGQVYSPPYLFQGTRPTITSAPETVRYTDQMFIGTPDAAAITNVRWVRLGTATHAQNWDQYITDADFSVSADGTGLNVDAPTSAAATPPGYYMLFILKGDVPSVAKIVRVAPMLPSLSVDDAEATEGPDGTITNLVFTVSLSLTTDQPVTVSYATAADTAADGLDYQGQTGILTFAPLVKTQLVTVPILGDALADPLETFTLNLSTPAGANLLKATGTGLIRDLNSLPVLKIKGTTLVEGDAGTSNATFLVSLSAPSTTPVTVVYNTADETATAPHDYVTTSGALTFAPGVTQLPIVVPVVGDAFDDPNNTFLVKLSAPTGATIDTAQAEGLIINNDDPPYANLVNPVTVNEPTSGAGTAIVTMTLSAPSGKTVTANWTTAADTTAQPRVNYVDQLGQVTFLPGETMKTFTVTVLNDGIKTPNLTFSVQMQSEVDSANYGNRYSQITIVNTDPLPTVSLSNVSIVEGNSGTASAVFTATLSAASTQQIKVAFATSAGTATKTTDYTETSGTLTFAAGTTTRTITVPVKGDTTVESNETFNVKLSNPTNVKLGAASAVGTIVDNDNPNVPAAPTNLTGVAGYGTVALTWQGVAGATSYNVYRGTSPSGEGTTPIATGIVGTAFTDTKLTNGVTYYYRVTAVKKPAATAYEGSRSAELAIAPNAYNFANGFSGRNLDPTVANNLDDSAFLSLNGLNVFNVRSFGTTLQLTDGGTNQTDSVFTRLPVNVQRFTTTFTFQQIPSLHYTKTLADGMTFTIQSVGPQAMGVSGGGLGYLGIPNSVAVKFDLFDNDGEGNNSTGLYSGGAEPGPAGSVNLTGTGIDLHSGNPFAVTMSYDGVTLKVTIVDTVTQAKATQSYAVNIPALVGGNAAYIGFTGGTGGLTAVQKIVNWVYTPAPAAPTALAATGNTAAQVTLAWTNNDPNAGSVLIERKTGAAGTYVQIGTAAAGATSFVDTTVGSGITYLYRVRSATNGATSAYSNEITVTTPPTLNFAAGFSGTASQFKFNGSTAKIVGTTLQLTDTTTSKAASAWAVMPVNVTGFSTQFNMQLLNGTNPSGEGITFTIQGNTTSALGNNAGGLGYGGIGKSVAVKFDLVSTSGEGINSTGLYTLGAAPTSAGSINLTGTGIDLHSGHTFNVAMVYNGVTLQVTITDTVTLAKATQTYTVNIPALVGANTAFVGFTGSTSTQTATQKILNWTYTAAPAADLQITNTNNQTSAVAGSPVTYTIVVSNAGPSSVGGAAVSDIFPTALTNVTYTAVATGGATNFTAAGTGNIADVVNLPAGSKITYTVSGTISAAATGAISNTATVTAPAGITELNAANNSATDVDSLSIAPAIDFAAGFAGAAAQLNIQGTAAQIAGTKLQLTDGGPTEAGSIWAKTKVGVAAFTTQFSIQMAAGTAFTADGMTFTIQNASATALGGAGGALGYTGITNSVAVKFDLFDNAGEGNNSTGLYSGGVEPNAIDSINLTGTGIDFHSGHVFNVSMTYNGTTLQVTITDAVTLASATQAYTVNIPALVGGDTAWVGFTAGTGGLTAVNTVLNWTYSVTTPGGGAALALAALSTGQGSGKGLGSSTTPAASSAKSQSSAASAASTNATMLMEAPADSKKPTKKPKA